MVRCPGSKPGKYVEMYTVRTYIELAAHLHAIQATYLSNNRRAPACKHSNDIDMIWEGIIIRTAFIAILLLLFILFICIRYTICYLFMHVCLQYKVPAGCIVIFNNPSAYTRANQVTTLAPRYTGNGESHLISLLDLLTTTTTTTTTVSYVTSVFRRT